ALVVAAIRALAVAAGHGGAAVCARTVPRSQSQIPAAGADRLGAADRAGRLAAVGDRIAEFVYPRRGAAPAGGRLWPVLDADCRIRLAGKSLRRASLCPSELPRNGPADRRQPAPQRRHHPRRAQPARSIHLLLPGQCAALHTAPVVIGEYFLLVGRVE